MVTYYSKVKEEAEDSRDANGTPLDLTTTGNSNDADPSLKSFQNSFGILDNLQPGKVIKEEMKGIGPTLDKTRRAKRKHFKSFNIEDVLGEDNNEIVMEQQWNRGTREQSNGSAFHVPVKHKTFNDAKRENFADSELSRPSSIGDALWPSIDKLNDRRSSIVLETSKDKRLHHLYRDETVHYLELLRHTYVSRIQPIGSLISLPMTCQLGAPLSAIPALVQGSTFSQVTEDIQQEKYVVSKERLNRKCVCDECGKNYSTASNLARHKQTHRHVTDKKARQCPHCEKVYVSMPAYAMHVRTHDNGSACPYCHKRFSRPWLLQGHIRTHTGEKPFACHHCGKRFADRSNLRAHTQTHASIKKYVCRRCRKAFALKSYLYKHEESSCMKNTRFSIETTVS